MIDEKKLVDDTMKLLNWLMERQEDGLPTSLGMLLDKFIETIHKQPKVGEWIPVEERLPEPMEEVFVTVKNGKVNRTWVDTFGRFWNSTSKRSTYYRNGSVLAWQPLPEPYKKESD